MANQNNDILEAQEEHDKSAKIAKASEKAELQTEAVVIATGPSSHEDAGEEIEYPTSVRLALIVMPLIIVGFLIFLDSSIIVTAIPKITSDFGSIANLGWFGSVYLLSNCAVQPLVGKFYSHFNLKWTFLMFLGVFELGSLLCGVSTSSQMLIFGRALAGAGGAGLMNGGIVIISACVPLERRPVFVGMLLALAQLGIVSGPTIGGALTQFTTWRWCFYINLPAGGVVAANILVTVIPEDPARTMKRESFTKALASIDWLGFLIFVSAIIMFLFALQWGGNMYAWNSATIIGLLVGSFIGCGLFFVWEQRKGSTALIPLDTVRNRIVYSSCLTMFFQMGNLVLTMYYLPLWFQIVKGNTPTLCGVYLLPMVGSQILFAAISGGLVTWYGQYLPFCILNAVLVSIGSGLMTKLQVSTGLGLWIGAEVLLGSGRGCGLQMPFIAIQNALPPLQAAIGVSLAIFSQYFGGAVFTAFAETILVNSLSNDLKNSAIDPQVIIQAGGTTLRTAVPKSDLQAVILAYDDAISNVFYLATASAIVMFFTSSTMGWIKDKKIQTESH